MITHLNHYNVRTADLERSIRFYRDTLGLRLGPRPNFQFPGAWMYCGEVPVVHLMQRGAAASGYTGTAPEGDARPDTGRLDHVAFLAEDLGGFKARLAGLGVDYTERSVPGQKIVQLFLDDPDGVRIELNFPAAA